MNNHTLLNFTDHWTGLLALALFVLAYCLVIIEENIHLRKSKPVMVAAGAIWILTAIAYTSTGHADTATDLLRHNLLEYAELMLFLMSAMTFINVMEDRLVFESLRARLVSAGLSLRGIFWLTGVIAFLMSPIADNLTTALVMGAVVITIGAGNARFIAIACINVVIAANAGGAFSPFGDITTLMVWQAGILHFFEFFALFVPSVVNWLIPAILMSFAVPKEKPATSKQAVSVKYGGYTIVLLFLLTITGTVLLHQTLHMPPFLGMMTGLGILKCYGYVIRRHELKTFEPGAESFDIFVSIRRIEWDTLMFFYGIILCVGGLGALGYLAAISDFFYTDLGPTTANILVGVLSALIDNIPVMFAILSMNPDMDHGQWLLVTLTTGVGGSLLSIGSAAGVALMGQAKGGYTFFSHLKWTWAIALGYAASIAAHMVINSHLFNP